MINEKTYVLDESDNNKILTMEVTQKVQGGAIYIKTGHYTVRVGLYEEGFEVIVWDEDLESEDSDNDPIHHIKLETK